MSDRKMTFPENKYLEWFIIGASAVLIVLGLIAPFFIFNVGAPVASWGLLSWEPYVALLSLVIYTIVAGIVWNKIRKRK